MPMKNDDDDDHFDNEPKMDINTDWFCMRRWW